MLDDPPDLHIVAGVDRRLEANLDGLRIAGPVAWPFIVAAYDDFPEKGELFLYAWMAIEQDDGRMAEAVELGRRSKDEARGLVGALGWHRPESIAPLVRDWIGAQDAFKRFLGVSACLRHGVDPKQMLGRLIRDSDGRVRAAGLRLAGELKRADLANELRTALEDTEEQPRFWAAWALAEVGSGDLAGPELRKVAAGGGPDAMTALRAAIKAAPDKDARAWMGGLLKSPETAPLAVRGAGMLGDRTLLHWLIRQMRNPALAPAAGAAFLELFPEARGADLFTSEPGQVGSAFQDHFGDDVAKVPFADKVKDWGAASQLLSDSAVTAQG
ncbi:HEAT repeat domain-containing protein [Mesorhizobium sp. MSK_1335]|uniref:HEAT repeat domain-containing protein n=1 Tax=Mesorhizobium montanum TaxID=3072323 RepID=A0ABU4ZEI9_9HYPH|nr:HEAT repeat domain-containing protein [Mesorhizobium sp. MSK_1335]MDX8523715.1 HEAT repeat domain-containing protein [Mesorhizobium sp. MSK_1335]